MFLFALFSSCKTKRASPDVVAVDDLGSFKPFPRPKRAKRVVSLSPSTTETVVALGAFSQLKGRSRYCNEPKAVLNLPVVGGFIDLNLEAIVKLEPDLVVGARGPSGSDILSFFHSQNVETYFPPTENVAEIKASIVGLGEKLDRNEEARALVAAMDSDFFHLQKETCAFSKKHVQPRVLWLFSIRPLVAAGKKSFAGELLSLLCAQNVVTGEVAYPTLNEEAVFATHIDVIVDTSSPTSESSSSSEAKEWSSERALGLLWKKIDAVEKGHVFKLDDDALLRPGPRVAFAAYLLAQKLYPSLRLDEPRTKAPFPNMSSLPSSPPSH